MSATVPLLIDGITPSTRQIADAAGIAEGTIFRVFADKDEVLAAAVAHVLDPAPTISALTAIDAGDPMDRQIAEAARAIQDRLSVIWRVVDAAGLALDAPRPPADMPILTELLARHRGALRDEPTSAARKLRALTLACSHPALVEAPLDPTEIASLFLDGLRVRPSEETTC